MKAYDDAFHRQILFNFSERRGAEKKNALETGRISRFVDVDLDHNTQAYNVETTDHRELSRYVLEDMLRTRQDDKFLVLVDKSAEEYSGSPKDAAASQRKSGLGGEDIRISGRIYHCLKATISNCTQHDEIRLRMTEAHFFAQFEHGGGGFTISFNGTDFSLPVSWREMVEHPERIMFFGPPLLGLRSFEEIFRFKRNIQYAHHIFRQFAAEYKGDSRMSAILYAAYQKRLRLIWEMKYNASLASNAGLFDKQTWNTPGAKTFCRLFNNLCKHSFRYCMVAYQDYSMPIVSENDFIVYLDIAKIVFKPQWRFLRSLRNVRPSDSKAMCDFKDRQIFSQILALQRVSNFRELTYWALINTTAYYGWGVRGSVTNAGTFWGNTASNSFRNTEFSRLFRNITQLQRALLKKESSGIFVMIIAKWGRD